MEYILAAVALFIGTKIYETVLEKRRLIERHQEEIRRLRRMAEDLQVKRGPEK